MRGIDNLDKHIENIAEFGIPALVVINRYADDLMKSLTLLKRRSKDAALPYVLQLSGKTAAEAGLRLHKFLSGSARLTRASGSFMRSAIRSRL